MFCEKGLLLVECEGLFIHFDCHSQFPPLISPTPCSAIELLGKDGVRGRAGTSGSNRSLCLMFWKQQLFLCAFAVGEPIKGNQIPENFRGRTCGRTVTGAINERNSGHCSKTDPASHHSVTVLPFTALWQDFSVVKSFISVFSHFSAVFLQSELWMTAFSRALFTTNTTSTHTLSCLHVFVSHLKLSFFWTPLSLPCYPFDYF